MAKEDNVRDVQRAIKAASAIIDGRNPTELASILVTAEHAFAAVLLTVYQGDARKAALMLNEGLVQGIERRLALYASKGHT